MAWFNSKEEKITTLNLRNKGLISIPPEVFKYPNLQKLDLSENRITSLPREIGNLVNLQYLNLNENNITFLPSEIGNLVNLQVLGLGVNNTSISREIRKLVNIQELGVEINTNRITSLPREIGNLVNLQVLNLSENNITSLPSEIGNLVNLQSLNLDTNNITSLPSEIGNLVNLQVLNLSENNITSLPSETGNLVNLQVLNLNKNSITTLPREIGNLVNLGVLELSENSITTLPREIGNLMNLKGLILSENSITNVPDEMLNLTNLQGLFLRGNPFEIDFDMRDPGYKEIYEANKVSSEKVISPCSFFLGAKIQNHKMLASFRDIQDILQKSTLTTETSFSSEEILKSFTSRKNIAKSDINFFPYFRLVLGPDLEKQLNCASLPVLFRFTDGDVAYNFGTNDADDQIVMPNIVMQDFGLRFLLTLPSRQIKFKLFDIMGNGRNFQTLVGLHQSIITNDVIDNSQEIRDYLQELRQHEGHLTMNVLKGKTSLEEYNRAYPEQAIPYHFLFIANFPAGFTEDTITTLRNIIQHGRASGIYVLMTTTSKTEELSSSVQRIAEEILTQYAADVFDWSSYAGIKENTKDFDWEEALRTTGTRVEYDDILFNRELLIQAINAEASTVKKVISKVTVEQSELWTKNSSPGLTIPIGRTVSQGIQNFTFGFDSEVYHGLVGGKTGSGKSVLLHNIIVNGARLYSPDELQFILLDYKEGTEFKIYAGLPHTRVLSIDSEREFGLSVLEFLQETINERGKAFKEAGVANITDYRSATNKKLPRFVVVIDEFQVLLSGGDTLATKSSDALADIVKRGRSFGIHILLSTQTLFDTDISVSTLSNIGLRIGLMMQEADAVKLMHFDNIAPSKLQRAGQAIYNTRNGLAEGNEEFQISFTTGEEIKESVAAIQHYAESVAYPVAHECLVFDGTSEGSIGTNSELMKAIQNKNFTVNDASAIAYIGEPALMQSSHCGIKFRKQFGSHTLIVGQDEVAAISIVYHSLYQILHQSSSGSRVVVFDFFNVDSNLRGQFASLKEQFDTVEIISRTSRVQEVIQEFYDETKARMDDETRPGRWVLVILNLHNAHSLQEDYSIQDQFKEILKNGPEGGIHVILYSNTYQPLQEVVGRDGINRCSTKIALSGSDSIQLFDTYNLKPIKKLSTALIQTHGTKYDYDSIKVYSLDKSKLQ